MVDVYLSDIRNQAAAEAFFKQAQNITGITPEQITTDKEPALYPSAKNIFGANTKHRYSKYMNNMIEQDHINNPIIRLENKSITTATYNQPSLVPI